MAWGLTAAGFVRKTLDEITTGIGDRLRTLRGKAIKLIAQSLYGQIFGIVSGELDEAWQVLEELNAARDPDSATDAALDTICEYTGTVRKGATYSTGQLLLTGDTGVPVPAGSRAQNQVGDLASETTVDATLAAATAWSSGASIQVGEVRTSAGQVYYCKTAGTTGNVGENPTAQTPYPGVVADNTVEWWWIGEGSAYALVAARAAVIGAVAISAFQQTDIGTPITGWRGVANPKDFTTGAETESDPDLRIRRRKELQGLGKATVPAVEAAISALPLVTSVRVFENPTDVTDADGIPPHAIEALVSGTAAPADIAAAIFNKAAGIQTHGSQSYAHVDSKGRTWTIRWNVPTPVRVYLEATLYVDDRWPTELNELGENVGEVAAKAALLAHADGLGVAYDARPGGFVAALKPGQDAGIGALGLLDAVVKVDDVPITGATAVAPVEVGIREVADVDATDVTIVVVSVVP